MTDIIQANTVKVYSKDGKLYTGMTVEEGYNKDYELFNFVDKDGSGVLSEKEIQRYDGPSLVINRENKSYRFTGTYHGRNGLLGTSYGNVSGDIIADKEYEFYPGLELGDVKDSEFNMVFRDLDLNKDRKLSLEEMQKYYDYVTRKKEYNERYENEVEQNYREQVFKGLWKPLVKCMASALGATFLGSCANYFADNIKCKFLRGTTKTVSFLGFACGGAVLVFHIAINNAKKLQEKYLYPAEQQLDKEFADLKQKDRQYKNVYQDLH